MASVTPEPAPEPEPRPRRRRGRTTLLIAGAAVLGVVAGTCTGYVVQAGRAPTKLPSLSQPALAQAKGPAPEPLSAAQDRRVRTDGDLRKLLLKKPAGARYDGALTGNDGWMDLADYAETFDKPGSVFGELISSEYRRAAVTGWDVGSTYGVEIRLIQYRQEETMDASVDSKDQQYWKDLKAGTDSWPIPGTGDGMVYVHSRPEHKPGYLPQYNAEAVAWRGDILLEIYVWDITKPVPKAKVMDVAKRQMERL
ncbi:hypothetical protein P2Q00_38220 [Streptomyces coacervatus]|uniref:hypothetical protein n=1 Tax=Streptomyces coacervatus TaxID=647381 RepID=UPI0023DCA291|nr:hypothetical protein [Streptomyces coacervatus]MDF2271224.1 hypothetical protein [Streptomyces coacervatus]